MDIDNSSCLIDSLKALKIIKESKLSNEINLEKLEKITPFLITPLTAYFNLNKLLKIKLPLNENINSYLETLKFPKTTTFCRTNKKTYTPLYEIKNEFVGSEENGEILDLIEKIIIDKFNLEKNISLLMSVFDELICNIQQHSKSNFNCIQAQLYGNKLAISLVDTGITIPQNYIEKGIRNYDNNLDLFKLAFKGISTKEEKTRGTGIPNTFNWICNGLKGNLVIISKDVAFKKIFGENIEFIDLKDLEFIFNGTIINLLFEIPKRKINWAKFVNLPLPL